MSSKGGFGSLSTWDRAVRNAVIAGFVLLAATFAVALVARIGAMSSLAGDVSSTLQRQCASYEKLLTADRTKSLFRLSASMKQLSAMIAERPDGVDDAFFEQQAAELRLTGISLLNGDLMLEASGYTRQFRDANWVNSALGSLVGDIASRPAKVFAERMQVDGAYYDVCAVARRDAPGILIGFYEQPSGLVSGTEDDLESLLSGLALDDGGNYVIALGGRVQASSDDDMKDLDVADVGLLSQISSLANDGKLHAMRLDAGLSWGYHSAAASYELYVYYPPAAIFVVPCICVGVVAVVYLLLCLAYFFLRARSLYRNQEQLERANHELGRTVEMLKSLETIYFTLFRVDLEANTYQTIYLAPWLEGAVAPEGSFADLKSLFLGTFVQPGFRTVLARRMSSAYIKQSLSKANTTDFRKSFYTDYVAARSGEQRWCRVTVTVVDYGADGTPARVLALLQDVDKEKKREALYQRRILEQARAARIANSAKSEFLRRISHDVRTPINGAKGYIQLAEAHPEDAGLQRRCREKATVALDTLMSLVNSVLDMTKLEGSEVALEHRRLDLDDVLRKVETVVAPQADAKGIAYRIARLPEGSQPRLVGSPRHVGQVLMNLVVNAVKYGKPGGFVKLDVVPAGVEGGRAAYRFVCSDDGIGIGEEFQRHMFEPFTQEAPGARTVYQGSGMGLAIVRKLVDAMGGSISCESRKGAGTTFAVELEFDVEQGGASGADDARTDGDPLSGAQVLLVEDNEMNMEIAECLLVDLGAKVTCAWDGQQAVDAFAASAPGTFDIVFMDIMMPLKNGLEATRAIRALDRPDAATVPICAMSANAFPDDVEASIEAGMDAHLPKPIDVDKALPVIARLMGFGE